MDAQRAELLRRGLDDPDPIVKGVAMFLHLDEAQPNAAAALWSRATAPGGALSDEDQFIVVEWMRREAAAGRPAPVAAPACRWALEAGSPALRSRAAAACALSTDAGAAILLRFAQDPEWQVRARLAAAVASHSGTPGASVVLNLLGRDPHPTVRRAASYRAGAGAVVDGEIKGTTPLELTNVSPGDHTVEITKDGYKPVSEVIAIQMGSETIIVGRTLEPLPNGPATPRVTSTQETGIGFPVAGLFLGLGIAFTYRRFK